MSDPKHTHTDSEKFDKILQENIPETPKETAPKTEPEIAPAQEAEVGLGEKESSTPPAKEEGFLEESISALKRTLKSTKKKPTQIPQFKDEITVKIEKMMEEDLSDVYQELTPLQQQEFKIKGEQTAYKIREIMKGAHVKAKTIFKLILEWLKMLPGINKFFLEQEAKIKTDKILGLKK